MTYCLGGRPGRLRCLPIRAAVLRYPFGLGIAGAGRSAMVFGGQGLTVVGGLPGEALSFTMPIVGHEDQDCWLPPELAMLLL